MQPTVLSPVNISEIVAQAKFKQNDKIFNNFIGLRLKEITKGNYIQKLYLILKPIAAFHILYFMTLFGVFQNQPKLFMTDFEDF